MDMSEFLSFNRYSLDSQELEDLLKQGTDTDPPVVKPDFGDNYGGDYGDDKKNSSNPSHHSNPRSRPTMVRTNKISIIVNQNQQDSEDLFQNDVLSFGYSEITGRSKGEVKKSKLDSDVWNPLESPLMLFSGFWLLIIGYMQMFLSSGIIWGWTSLLHMLKEEDAFSSLCDSAHPSPCPAQDKHFAFIFACGSTGIYLSNIPFGFLLDLAGPRITACKNPPSYITLTF